MEVIFIIEYQYILDSSNFIVWTSVKMEPQMFSEIAKLMEQVSLPFFPKRDKFFVY